MAKRPVSSLAWRCSGTTVCEMRKGSWDQDIRLCGCAHSGSFLLWILLLEEVAQAFGALFDGARLGDFVEGLVFFENVVFAFVVDVDVGALDVS